MMKLETIAIAGCLALAVSPLAQQRLFAQEAPAEAEEAEAAEQNGSDHPQYLRNAVTDEEIAR